MTTLKIGDYIQALRTIRPYFHKNSVYRVAKIENETTYLNNDFALFGREACVNLHEGRSWARWEKP